MTIRPYQTKAEDDILTGWQSCQRVMLQAPTGSGKTVIVTNLIRHLIVQGKRVMFIAHREELISQAWQTFYKNKIVSGIVKAGIEPNWALPVQIGSVQTMTRRKALPKADYFIIDEAHHCLEDNSYGRIIKEHYPEAFVLGVTATPYRLYGRGFTKIFDLLIETVQLPDLIQMGYLVPLRYFVSSLPDLTNVKITAGDYAEEQAAKAMGNAPIVESYKEHADGLCGIVFAVTVEHSKKIVEQYTTAGIRAEHVDATTPLDLRRGIFQRLRDRTSQIVVNVGIATEGVDIPNIDFVQLARPTKSLSLFFQMCLDLNTEVLTKDGWRHHYEISNGDIVASFNTDTQAVSFDPCSNKVFRPLQERESLIQLSSPFVDLRVSDRHDLIVRERTTRQKIYGGWRKLTASDASEIPQEYQIPIAGFVNNPDVPLTDNELKFIGWVLSDGSINKRTKALCINQSLAQPDSYHESIIASIVGCGFKFGQCRVKRTGVNSKYQDAIYYTISHGKPRGQDKHLTGWSRLAPYLDKNISDQLMRISRRQLGVLLTTINLGDGIKYKTITDWTPRSMQITAGNNLIYAERLQILCITNGYKCNISTHSYNKSPLYNLHIKDRNYATIKGKNQFDGNRLTDIGYIKQNVWCVSTKNGTLITRRNGKVVIMGNCGRGTRVDNEVIKDAGSDEHRRFLISCSSKPALIVLDNAGLWAEHGLPDQPINWQKHFNGYKRPKKTPEEMIEILEFIAEDDDGRTVRTKIPKEVEGLKLIEIRKTERDRIVNLTSLKEFDRLYALFKNLPKINKPGFKAYFEYREHCLKNAFLMTDDVWAYLDRRLAGEASAIERDLQGQADKKFEHIMARYGSNPKDKDFLMANVQKRLDKDLTDLRRISVPSGFLKKEKQKYEAATKVGVELLHTIPA